MNLIPILTVKIKMVFKGQMLTLVEYIVLLYRALLPAPVWYRFFLNKEYGSLFSSLIAGLYLTFKLISIAEKAWISFGLIYWVILCFIYLVCKCWVFFTTPLFLGVFTGSVSLCFFEGLVSHRDSVWNLCYIGAGVLLSFFVRDHLCCVLEISCYFII